MANTVLVNTVPNYPYSVVTVNNMLYYSSILATTFVIKSINLQNPDNSQIIKTYSDVTSSVLLGLPVDSTYLYVTYDKYVGDAKYSYIDRIDLATNVSSPWFNEISYDLISTVTIVGNYLYYVMYGDSGFTNEIYRINISSTPPTSSLFINTNNIGISYLSFVNDGTYLYFETLTFNSADNTITFYIAKCNASDAADYNPTWFKLRGSMSLGEIINITYATFTVAGNYLYAAITNTTLSEPNAIAKISLSNPAGDNNLNWFSLGKNVIYSITNDNTYLYMSNFTLQAISKLPLSYASISNICFPAGTPIQTDQGIVNIEKIDTKMHTIRGQPIRHITNTITFDKYLICFKKNSIGINIPNKTTIMSKDHQIVFQGRLVPAYRFLNFSSEVKKVKYNGEHLYNVLLDHYSTINVNNLICETLHPDNKVAMQFHGGHPSVALVRQPPSTSFNPHQLKSTLVKARQPIST